MEKNDFLEQEETADSNLEANQEEFENQAEPEQATENVLEEAELHKQLEAKTAQCEELFGRLARLHADFDNFKKRTSKEKEEFYKYASEKLIIGLLPVLDNFERALSTAGENQELKTGVEMIYKQLNEALKVEGLELMEAVGKEFDPSEHQAIMQVESEDYAENIVAEEFQKGYKLKDKVIRYAMVKVAK